MVSTWGLPRNHSGMSVSIVGLIEVYGERVGLKQTKPLLLEGVEHCDVGTNKTIFKFSLNDCLLVFKR